ncbi:hypothetical protein KZX45_02470 [Georgenia sp. EYE_87]|uniref:hypothetical protein n=1 Tax=Georgenia sp. EYE_87 TaxID=2853448 RepID=UPI00200577D0|nr:hypothetical protein [Georgenia sp. EYE_87]MCK6209404.1 hypothetical protein [Georgenia sp. EYE_87]
MNGAPAAPEDLFLVSDLHLGAYEQPGGPHDRAFAEFVDAVARAQDRRGRSWRLVLLGDFLDFPAAAPRTRSSRGIGAAARAAAVMDRVQRCAPLSLAGVRSLLERGGRVDVVAGNHDFELMHPDVQRVVADRLRAGTGGLAFHPWLYRVDGLLHAEHGSQHHDINRVGCLLAQAEQLSRGTPRTPAAVLARAHRDGSAGTVRGMAGTAAVPILAAAMLVAASRADGMRARASYAGHLEAYAPSVDLPADVLAELDGVSRVSTTATVLRILRRTAGRGAQHEMNQVMTASAAAVHEVLRTHHRETPFYVFGHTHEARRVELPTPRSSTDRPALYLNTGTWSPFARGVNAVHQRDRPTWVHIDATACRARLCRWGVDKP